MIERYFKIQSPFSSSLKDVHKIIFYKNDSNLVDCSVSWYELKNKNYKSLFGKNIGLFEYNKKGDVTLVSTLELFNQQKGAWLPDRWQNGMIIEERK